ncbi:MAG TPA: hypothetical protein VGM32_25095 [Rhodopila sp.]|jgi:hypothetical protein
MDAVPNAAGELDDRDLVLRFESIGDNCELGLLQRHVGAEPLGLLRFAGAPVRNLVRALNARFAGIADPARIRIEAENGEYMVKLAAYNFSQHAEVKVGQMPAEAVHERQCRAARFLANKLIDDLTNGDKILVFRQNEPLLAGDLVDLRMALASYGPYRLLWVQEACPGHPPGSVDVADERMMVGYVRRLASRQEVPQLDRESWLGVLRRAHAISLDAVDGRLAPGAAVRPRSTELAFGREGDAGPCLGAGWSGPEAGFTWAVGERSVVTIEVPGSADEYWLEMELRPYIAPPLLPRQRLDVAIEGTWVHSFSALPRGEVGCPVPGALVAGRKSIEVVLGHPHAASPMLVAGEGDARRLGAAFYRLALVCA